MLDKIAKTLKVVERLKELPLKERQWLLDECKSITEHRVHQYTAMFKSASNESERYQLMQRLNTLKVARELLGTINIRMS